MQDLSRFLWKVRSAALSASLVLCLSAAPAFSQRPGERLRTEHFSMDVRGKVSRHTLARFANAFDAEYDAVSSRVPLIVPGELSLVLSFSARPEPKPWESDEGIISLEPETIVVYARRDWENSSSWRRAFDRELLRTILLPRLREGCPRWLIEGVALVFSGDSIADQLGEGAGNLRHLSDLDERLMLARKHDPGLQAVIVATVMNLRMRFGDEAVFQLLRQCSQSSFDSVTRMVLHEPLLDLESWWRLNLFHRPE